VTPFFVDSENQRPSNEEQFSHNQQQQHENQKDNSPNFGNNINSELHESSYQYWISKWVDLSQKFGLGYNTFKLSYRNDSI
jgi:hypothetical protein